MSEHRIREINITPEKLAPAIARDGKFFVWLDSADISHPSSHWSFMAIDPDETILYQNSCITHKTPKGQSMFKHADPFAYLRERLASYGYNAPLTPTQCAQKERLPEHQERPLLESIPFSGGAAGYFGYDLGRTIEYLPSQAQSEQNAPDMAIGIFNQVFAYDHKNAQGYLITRGQNALLREHAFMEIIVQHNAHSAPAESQHPRSDLSLRFAPDKNQNAYQNDIQSVIDYIHAGDIFQANLSQRFWADIPDGFDTLSHYLHLREVNAAPFAGYIHCEKTVISSASPERFLSCDKDGHIETKPIKGTAARHKNAAADLDAKAKLSNSIKDRAENIMIVDLLRNDLSKSCDARSIKVENLCAIESFARVHHLVSTIHGSLKKGKDSLEILRGAFPGGSITGAPKIRAMEIIEELEPYKRGPYCGSMGYIDFNGAMDTNILIRTVIFSQNKASFHVGGGIVARSNPDVEYQETLDKAAGILDSFQSPSNHENKKQESHAA